MPTENGTETLPQTQLQRYASHPRLLTLKSCYTDNDHQGPSSKLRKVADNQAVPVPAIPAPAPVSQYEPPDDLPDKISELLEARQGPATALQKSLTHAINAAEKKGAYSPSDGVSNESRAERLAIAIERAVHDTHQSLSSYKNQTRTLAHNLKNNQELIMRLVNHSLTPPKLAAMSTEELASKELQQETAEMKARAEKQSILIADEGPRIRRTHKGEELVGDDNAATNFDETPSLARRASLRVDTPGESSKTGEQANTPDATPAASSAQPLRAGEPMQIDTQQSPRNDFDINKVFSSVKSPTVAQRRRPSAPAPLNGPGDDPEVDRLLQEDGSESPPYSPTEETDPEIVWRGHVQMPSIGSFQATAKHMGGANLANALGIPWTTLVPKQLTVAGRIEASKATTYLCGLRWSNNTDIVVASLSPVTEAGKADFNAVIDYFVAKERYAVIGDKGVANVRDTYLIPVLAGTNGHPEFILNLEDNFIPQERTENMLLLVIIYRNEDEVMDRLQGPGWRDKVHGHWPGDEARNNSSSRSPAPAATPTPGPNPAPGQGPAGFARREQSMSGPTFSPTTPQVGAGGMQSPWGSQNPSHPQQTPSHVQQPPLASTPSKQSASPGPYQQHPHPQHASVPPQHQLQPVHDREQSQAEKQQAGEAIARNILGPLITCPTVQFLTPHAAVMRVEEWHVIKRLYERDPKARIDLNYLSQLLENESRPKPQSQPPQQQASSSAPQPSPAPMASAPMASPAPSAPSTTPASSFVHGPPQIPQTVTPVPPAPPVPSPNTPAQPAPPARTVKQTPIPLPHIPGMAHMAQQAAQRAASNALQSPAPPTPVPRQQAAAATPAPPA